MKCIAHTSVTGKLLYRVPLVQTQDHCDGCAAKRTATALVVHWNADDRSSDAGTAVSFATVESSRYKRRRTAMPTLPTDPQGCDFTLEPWVRTLPGCVHQVAVHEHRSQTVWDRFVLAYTGILEFSLLTAFHTLSLLHFPLLHFHPCDLLPHFPLTHFQRPHFASFLWSLGCITWQVRERRLDRRRRLTVVKAWPSSRSWRGW